MPAIIDPADFSAWLDSKATPEAVASLLRPYPAGRMTADEVSTLVNSPKNDRPACVEAVACGPV